MWLTLMSPWGIDIEALSPEWKEVARTAAEKPAAQRAKAGAEAAAKRVPKRFRKL